MLRWARFTGVSRGRRRSVIGPHTGRALVSSTRNYTGPNALRMPEQTPECDILPAVLFARDSQFHPMRAAFWCVIAVLVIAVGLQLYRVQRIGWLPTGGSGQSFQIQRRISAGGREIGQHGETWFVETYEFMYSKSEFENPILKDQGPTACWVRLVDIYKIRDNIDLEDQPLRQQIAIEDLPDDVIREYEASAPEWVKIMTTLGPNEVLLGTSLDAPDNSFFPPLKARRAKLWTSGGMIDMLKYVAVNALVAVVVVVPPLYIIGYWFIYRSMIVHRRHVKGRCIRCSYPLPDLLCPECGTLNKPRRIRTNGPY